MYAPIQKPSRDFHAGKRSHGNVVNGALAHTHAKCRLRAIMHESLGPEIP